MSFCTQCLRYEKHLAVLQTHHGTIDTIKTVLKQSRQPIWPFKRTGDSAETHTALACTGLQQLKIISAQTAAHKGLHMTASVLDQEPMVLLTTEPLVPLTPAPPLTLLLDPLVAIRLDPLVPVLPGPLTTVIHSGRPIGTHSTTPTCTPSTRTAASSAYTKVADSSSSLYTGDTSYDLFSNEYKPTQSARSAGTAGGRCGYNSSGSVTSSDSQHNVMRQLNAPMGNQDNGGARPKQYKGIEFYSRVI
ncbi:hypothetical protein BSL78_26259 [Apostichopus japonicus]|uniref:Uncharacterized protein n=1 Tax=Stichopus japonicus TaxID=307972 RepID=A0A2G8JMB5_STIJA|nr:hypothetical protein BSL78_26259 [Apostichopus japonicus]